VEGDKFRDSSTRIVVTFVKGTAISYLRSTLAECKCKSNLFRKRHGIVGRRVSQLSSVSERANTTKHELCPRARAWDVPESVELLTNGYKYSGANAVLQIRQACSLCPVRATSTIQD